MPRDTEFSQRGKWGRDLSRQGHNLTYSCTNKLKDEFYFIRTQSETKEEQ